ncbi:MAG: GTPase Era, partial [Oligoflexia bacterium]|nr:GTPase Era [Oligoflexia bacterium]
MPNSGKSTLLNRLIGQKLAVVSEKPQTTRVNVLGVLTRDDAQLIFIDTPGYHDSDKKINRFFVREAAAACADADVIVHLFDAKKVKKSGLNNDEGFLKTLEEATRKKIVIPVLSKSDLVKKNELPGIAALISGTFSFNEKAVITAAPLGLGIPELIDLAVKHLPEGPMYFPEDTVSDRNARDLCAEIIREKIFRLLHD